MQMPLFSSPNDTPHAVPVELEGAEVTYFPQWLTPAESSSMITALKAELPWRQDTIKLFGKPVKIPRLQAWHGDPECRYQYSGLALTPAAWTPTLNTLRQSLQSQLNHPFNSVLANWYRDGNDSMALHADDEPELGDRPVIASVTLGEARPFVFRHRRTKKRTVLPLANGSVLIMAGDTQSNYLHGIAKTAKPVSDRINLTFRYVYPQ